MGVGSWALDAKTLSSPSAASEQSTPRSCGPVPPGSVSQVPITAHFPGALGHFHVPPALRAASQRLSVWPKPCIFVPSFFLLNLSTFQRKSEPSVSASLASLLETLLVTKRRRFHVPARRPRPPPRHFRAKGRGQNPISSDTSFWPNLPHLFPPHAAAHTEMPGGDELGGWPDPVSPQRHPSACSGRGGGISEDQRFSARDVLCVNKR